MSVDRSVTRPSFGWRARSDVAYTLTTIGRKVLSTVTMATIMTTVRRCGECDMLHTYVGEVLCLVPGQQQQLLEDRVVGGSAS